MRLPQPHRHGKHPSNEQYIGPYHFEWAAVKKETLKPLWENLYPLATANIFLSWPWIDSWLTVMAPSCRAVHVYHESQLVGLALLTCNRQRRHGVIQSRVLRLTRTGNSSEDQIWIEYNDLLMHKTHQAEIPPYFIEFLLGYNYWDEFEIGASTLQALGAYKSSLVPVISWSSPTYGVDLNRLRADGKSYLGSLSGNTRHQISRTKKLFELRGQLKFETVSSEAAIMDLWPSVGELHIERWGTNGSGFANQKFVDFHKTLISKLSALGQVELCVLKLNNEFLGFLYNFLHEGCVYFYLGSLRFEKDKRLKPGLLIHALAIQNYLDQGFEYYDFLGGEARYKKSLAAPGHTLQLVSYQRPRMTLKLERGARQLKNWARKNVYQFNPAEQ